MADIASLIAGYSPDVLGQMSRINQYDMDQINLNREGKILGLQDQLAAGTEDLMKKYSIYNPQGARQMFLNEKDQLDRFSRFARKINQAPLERRAQMYGQLIKAAPRLGIDVSDIPSVYNEEAQAYLMAADGLDMTSYQEAQLEENRLNREAANQRMLTQDRLERERLAEEYARKLQLEEYKASLKNNQQEEFNNLKDADKEALVAAENLPLAEQKLNDLISLIGKGYSSDNAIEGYLLSTSGKLGATGGTIQEQRKNQLLAENQAKNVILPLLRQTLGAQFTENEGKRILALLVPDPNEPISVRQDKVRQYIGELRDKVKSSIRGRRLEKYITNDSVRNLIIDKPAKNSSNGETVITKAGFKIREIK